jgi:hypothetical protein
MVFCCHCGKLSEGGRYCTACGRLVASTPATPVVADNRLDLVATMRAELDRDRKQMRFLVVGLCAVVISVGLIVSWVMHSGPTARNSVPEPPPRQQLPIQVPSTQAIAPDTSASQAPQKAVQATVPGASNPESQLSAGSIDPQQVQKALTALTPPAKQSAPPATQSVPSSPQETGPSAAQSGTDRYPGSQPVEVKDANLPDIGIPVAGEVYSTSDSVPTVVSYYTQRYPDAQVMEISGQKIIAVSRPGVTKVVAVGTTGQETRIAIVQPHD